MRVLLSDDDRSILQSIGEYLELHGAAVDYCENGVEAVALAVGNRYSVIVLDVRMPRLDGLDACRRIRAAGILTPMMFLTARDQLHDTLAGFAAGGDDYLVKPFSYEELLARIQALSKRLSRQGTSRIRVDDLEISLTSNDATRAGVPLRLNPMQFEILKRLALKSPGVVTRAELEEQVWGDNVPDSDALRTHIFKLRTIIDKPFATQLLRTVHGVGFRLCANDYPDAGLETPG